MSNSGACRSCVTV